MTSQEYRAQRLALGLTQDELAALLGYHRAYIGHLEHGRARIYQASIDALLGITPEQANAIIHARDPLAPRGRRVAH